MMVTKQSKRYRDSFEVLERLLEKIIENDSMTISQMESHANMTWTVAFRYVKKLMKGNLLEEAENHGRIGKSTAKHYKVTHLGSQMLKILKEMNK